MIWDGNLDSPKCLLSTSDEPAQSWRDPCGKRPLLALWDPWSTVPRPQVLEGGQKSQLSLCSKSLGNKHVVRTCQVQSSVLQAEDKEDKEALALGTDQGHGEERRTQAGTSKEVGSVPEWLSSLVVSP